MKRIVSLMIAIIATLSLAACQATPETPLVVGKDQEKMIEQAKFEPSETSESSQDSVTQSIGAPEIYRSSFEVRKVKVMADASVSVPKVDMPIVRVAARDFTQEEVSAFFKEFCGDTKLYNQARQMIKSEIEKEIILVRKKVEELKNTPDDPDNVDMSYGSNAEYAKYLETEYIPQLEREYTAAPAKREATVADGTMMLMNVAEAGSGAGTQMGVQAQENPGDWSAKGSPGKTFRAFNNPATLGQDGRESTRALISYTNYSVGDVMIDRAPVTPELEKKVGITAKQAQQTAEDVLAKYNLPFEVCEVVFVDNAEYVAFKKNAKYGMGLEVRCVRTVNGAPAAYIYGESNAGKDPEKIYMRSWTYERMAFMVNADGIFDFTWDSPLEIKEIILDKTELLPFEKIDSIFNKMMTVIYEPEANMYEGYVSYEIKIDKIKLELMRIPEQNSIENGLLVPVWRFYGSRNLVSDKGDITSMDNSIDGMSDQWCALVVNAIDGSIIDQYKGY